MKKRIFVTGAAGFVGSHLIPDLINKGYFVSALVKNNSEKRKVPRKIDIIVADLSKKGSWQKRIKNHEILIHLASEIASKNEYDFTKNNVIATANLVEAAKAAKVKKIIHFSSAAVTSIRLDSYAQTKKAQEEIISSSKIPYHLLRPSMIYGEGDTKNMGWLIKTIKNLPIIPLPGGGHFGRQPVYVGDICQVVIKLIEKKYSAKIYEIHGKEYVTMAQMVKTIQGALESKKKAITVPLWILTLTIFISQKILPNPKFTVDQIKSLTSGEKFIGDEWWETFDIIPTKFEKGISLMVKEK